MKKFKFDLLIFTTFITTMFYSATYPFINKAIITVASEKLIALNQIINCISIIIFGYVWNTYGKKLFNYYHIFCLIESLVNITTAIFVIQTGNLIGYYILDTICFSVVTRNIICGGTKLRAIRYNGEEKRERFDNNDRSASAAATVIGSLVAMVLKVDFKYLIILATFGNTIDNVLYTIIYFKTILHRNEK